MQMAIATMPTHSIISWVESARLRLEWPKANISMPITKAMLRTNFRMVCTSAISMNYPQAPRARTGGTGTFLRPTGPLQISVADALDKRTEHELCSSFVQGGHHVSRRCGGSRCIDLDRSVSRHDRRLGSGHFGDVASRVVGRVAVIRRGQYL